MLRSACVLAAVCLAACTVDRAQPAPARARADRVIGGTADTTTRAAVALVQNVGPCGEPVVDFVCSGVLVAPRVVLTAAHCLESVPPGALEIFFGPTVDGPGARVPVLEARIHPAYDESSHAFDVAAVVLASAAPADIPPAAARTAPITSTMVGANVRVVGYGTDDRTKGQPGLRRSGNATLSAVAEAELRIEPGPAMTCQGDSGGPVLMSTPSGEELVGITSWGDVPCTEFGAAVRVDRIASFLAPILAQSSAPVSQPPFDPDAPLCTTPCASHAECPLGTACTLGSEAPRCTFRGLAGYGLGRSCAHPEDCDEACLDTPVGCRCIARCSDGAATPAPAPPLRATGGGCAAGAASPASGLVSVLLVAWLARRRRSVPCSEQ